MINVNIPITICDALHEFNKEMESKKMTKSISLRESTQFPSSNEIDENTCYKRTYFEESNGLTTNGLVQIINYQTNEVVSQYLKVGKHQIALTPQTSYDDAISKLEECIKLIQ